MWDNKLYLKRILVFVIKISFLPLVLLIVLIRPLLFIRFGMMINIRIGHFMIDVEAYLCKREKKDAINSTFDIIYCPNPVCNIQAKLMWSRIVLILPGAVFWKYLDLACQFWTRGDKHHLQLYNLRSDYKLIPISNPHLRFNDKEIIKGNYLLKKLGIPSDALWICIHNRDSAYLDKIFGSTRSYHGKSGYDSHRDFDIKSMEKMCNRLTEMGYYVIRVGSVVTERLSINNSKVIDYALSTSRSDFLDIFLLANCYSYIGSDSGISCIPYIFRRPVCFINWNSANIDELVIREYAYPILIKKIWNCEKKYFLSIREIFELGLAGTDEAGIFEDAGLKIISNTSDEICCYAIELHRRLSDTWISDLEDE